MRYAIAEALENTWQKRRYITKTSIGRGFFVRSGDFRRKALDFRRVMRYNRSAGDYLSFIKYGSVDMEQKLKIMENCTSRLYYPYGLDMLTKHMALPHPLIVKCAGLYARNEDFTAYNPYGEPNYYLQYMLNGKTEQYFPDGTVTLGEGDLIIHSPGVKHHYRCITENSLIRYYCIHIYGTYAPTLFEHCNLKGETVYHIGVNTAIYDQFEDIFNEIMKSDSYTDLTLCSLANRLVLDIARAVNPQPSLRKDARILKTVEYMYRNYNKPLSIAELARSVFLSEQHYRKLFRDDYGISPHRYLMNIRLTMAKDMLLNSSTPINEIASAVGIPDSLSFSRVFSSQFGVSPRNFRNSKMNNSIDINGTKPPSA